MKLFLIVVLAVVALQWTDVTANTISCYNCEPGEKCDDKRNTECPSGTTQCVTVVTLARGKQGKQEKQLYRRCAAIEGDPCKVAPNQKIMKCIKCKEDGCNKTDPTKQ